ncbi:hypothetical protein LTR66_011766, partial [Elasticomyces elasticus]
STYLGCATEPSSGRALSAASVSNDSMTVDTCMSYCGSAGYALAGLEYGRECYCGNALASGSTTLPASDTSCNMACAGNKTQTCGGPSRLSLYNATRPANQVRHVVPSANGYASQGCYTEASSGRALTAFALTSDAMSVETCTQFCAAKGTAYAGVEYARECYCGNALAPGVAQEVVAAGQASACSMPCAGSDMEFCGGGSRLNLYKTG